MHTATNEDPRAFLATELEGKLPPTMRITGQIDGPIQRTINIALACSTTPDSQLAEIIKRHLLHMSSSRGRFMNSRAAMMASVLRADYLCNEEVIRRSYGQQAAAIRGGLENAAVFFRLMQKVRATLNRIAKRSPSPSLEALSKACLEIQQDSLELPSLGLVDMRELEESGTLQNRTEREDYADPKEVTQLRKAVTELSSLGYDAEMDYRFLSEFIHPAAASSFDNFKEPRLFSCRNLAFREMRPAGPTSSILAPKTQGALDRARFSLLELAVNLARDSAEMSATMLALFQSYIAAMIPLLNESSSSASAFLRSSLDEDVYALCLCLSERAYKFCCRRAIVGSKRMK